MAIGRPEQANDLPTYASYLDKQPVSPRDGGKGKGMACGGERRRLVSSGKRGVEEEKEE